ncbi:MAG: winged helix DNA-binding domain-containing protein [Gaiellaceae bacterium]
MGAARHAPSRARGRARALRRPTAGLAQGGRRPLTHDVLSPHALNRATLARQLLLRRADLSPLEAVEHLVGMQAQVPLNPYLGLWSRLEGFQPEELGRLLEERELVRIVAMRSTLHLLSAADALVLRPLAQPLLDRELARHPQFGPALDGVDLDAVLAFARPLLAERPRTGPELRAALAERFPAHDPPALAYACRNHLAVVQVPPRGVWGKTAQVTSATAESWLGRPLVAEPRADDVVLRYLAAFGPATAADVSAWSGLTGVREVVERLRPRLRTFRDESGRELLDLPDAPRPDPATPAPPRFLPEYDNVLLGHADRSRFVPTDGRGRLSAAWTQGGGSVLVDGFGRGVWRIERDRGTGAAVLVVSHVRPLAKRTGASLGAEGRRLLRFLAADAEAHDVRFARI